MRSPTRRSPRSCARSSSTAFGTPRRRRGLTERAVAARAALAESQPMGGRGLPLGPTGLAVFPVEGPVWAAQAMDVPAAAGRWLAPDAFADAAVPTVMRKIIEHGLRHTAATPGHD